MEPIAVAAGGGGGIGVLSSFSTQFRPKRTRAAPVLVSCFACNLRADMIDFVVQFAQVRL
jgi:hypothetical protein